jgi:hypothetical protein
VSTNRLRVAFLIALLVSPGGSFGQSKPLEMKWSELSPMVTGHRVTVTLSDGTAVKGEAITVREDALLLDVAIAMKGYPKGSGSIPRNSIALIDVERSRGSWGKGMGTIIGVLGGMSLGVYIIAKNVFKMSGGQATGTFVGVAAAGAIAGYFTGRAIDKRVTHIRIIP